MANIPQTTFQNILKNITILYDVYNNCFVKWYIRYDEQADM